MMSEQNEKMNLTTLCYIEQDGKYLMLHRVKKENDINKDKWLGIGGHFLANESPEECLLREVKEETGLVLNSWRFRGIVTFVQKDRMFEYMMLYTSDDFSGEMKECDEGEPVWIDKKKINTLELWEGDKIFFKLLDEERPFFSLKLVYDKDVLTQAFLDGKRYTETAAVSCDENGEIIARVMTGFPTKFGLPRQAGIVPELTGRIVFNEKYRVADAFRGLEDFDYIWVIWKFSEAKRKEWSPTVRPPRLGGNTRMGVFATRSPFRPNPIGLSCLKLEKIDYEAKDGPVLIVSGIDMMSGTPVYDIKPYLPYADAKFFARGGFTGNVASSADLSVEFEKDWDAGLVNGGKAISFEETKRLKSKLIAILSLDPRPSYQNDPERIYGFEFEDYEIGFRVEKNTAFVINATFREK